MQGPCEHSGTEGEGGGVRGCQGGRAVREREGESKREGGVVRKQKRESL